MTSRTNQPHESNQPGDLLGEESLLALVEGELSEAREREVLRALVARPDLAALVRGMTRDKALLSDLCDLEAPPEVIESIDAALERAALLDGPGAFADLPPAPIAMPRVRTERHLPRMLAMAAVLALLAGGVGFWALSRTGTGATSDPSRLAFNKEKASAPSEVESNKSDRLAAAPAASGNTGALAIAKKSEAAPANDAPADAIADLRVALNDAPSEALAPRPGEPGFVGPVLVEPSEPAAIASEVASGIVTPELAVELAAQGRLAVRVRANAIGRTLNGLDALASREGDRSWRLGKRLGADAPSTGEESAASGLNELARKDDRRAERETFERSVAVDPGMGNVREREARDDRRSTSGPSAYFASVSLTPEALASLRRTLESEGDATVEFEELEGPAQPGVDIGDSNPLWWDESPSRWVPWADVLVVVEE